MNIKACIVNIGTELVIGKIQETNSYYISGQLSQIGISVSSVIKLPDNKEVLRDYIDKMYKDNDLIILTGGLGPTQDDITKEVVAELFKRDLIFSDEIYRKIKDLFSRIKISMPDNNKSQAYVIKDSLVLNNKNGTAPGAIVEENNKYVVLLPGPPYELEAMFKDDVLPFLERKFNIKYKEYVIRLFNLGESLVSKKLETYDIDLKKLGAEVIYLSQPNFIDIIISVKGNVDINKIDHIVEQIRSIYSSNMYSDKWQSMYSVVHELFIEKKLTLSIAESCTGGLIGKTITDMPGSSEYFLYDIVSYDNKAKEIILNIDKDILINQGAVSEKTAISMIDGLESILNTDIKISVTGIAGPGGGTTQKPVGLVYIGIKFQSKTIVHQYNFTGTRDKIRLHVLNKVFELIYLILTR